MMGLNEFGKKVQVMIDRLEGDGDPLLSFRKGYRRCVEEFDDRDRNLKRWLMNRDCVFISPRTDQIISIKVGRDIEALYYFLLFCYKLNNRIEVSEEFQDYLALVLSRSQYQDDGVC